MMDKNALLKQLFKKKMALGGVAKKPDEPLMESSEDDDFDVADDYPADEEAMMQAAITDEGLDGPALTVSSNDLDELKKERQKVIGNIMMGRRLRR